MSPYEYFNLLVGVVVGLAISDLILSLHKLLIARRRVRWHWASPATALLSGILVIGEFLTFWFSKGNSVHFLRVLISMSMLVLLFLAVAAALPDEVPTEGLDLETFYFDNRRHFWGLMALFMTVQAFIIVFNPINRQAPGFQLSSRRIFS